MAKFLLLDPALRDVGGHYLGYDSLILDAARRAGFETLLAAQTRFKALDQVPAGCKLFAALPYVGNYRFCLGPLGHAKNPLGLDGEILESSQNRSATWSDAIHDWWQHSAFFRRIARRRRLRGFAAACRQVFDEAKISSEDVLYFATATEYSLLAIIRFLHELPANRQAVCHVQFHFPAFDGREPDYASQPKRRAAFQRQLSNALQQVSQYPLFLHASTENLTRQFSSLDVAPFTSLPWPVSSDLRPSPKAEGKRPLRITLAGLLRGEKGMREFDGLVQDVRTDLLASERAQFVVQCRAKDWRRGRVLSEGTRNSLNISGSVSSENSPVTTASFPLSEADYQSLIRKADIGLFLYDSKTYYARCSGVLVEMLAAGVPVVVPAGCWLADEVEESIFQHLERLQHEALAATSDVLVERMKASSSAGHVSLLVPENASDVLISWAEESPDRFGEYLEWSVVPHDDDSQILKSRKLQMELARGLAEKRGAEAEMQSLHKMNAAVRKSIVGRREAGKRPSTLLPIPIGAKRVTLKVRNAYSSNSIQLQEVQIRCLVKPRDAEHHPPGAVGLIAAGNEDIAFRLRQMVEHFPHFQDSARRFSEVWRKDHAGDRTIEKFQRVAKIARDAKRSGHRAA